MSGQEWQYELQAAIRETYRLAAETRVEYYTKVVDETCESPIEKILAARLLTALEFITPRSNQCFFGYRSEKTLSYLRGLFERFVVEDEASSKETSRTLAPQCQVGPYRADFVLLASYNFVEPKPSLQVIIECDGHDFHERSKEQAQRDRARDRWFQAQGFVVLRFTGSEIVRDASRCAGEVVDLLDRWEQGQRQIAGLCPENEP